MSSFLPPPIWRLCWRFVLLLRRSKFPVRCQASYLVQFFFYLFCDFLFILFHLEQHLPCWISGALGCEPFIMKLLLCRSETGAQEGDAITCVLEKTRYTFSLSLPTRLWVHATLCAASHRPKLLNQNLLLRCCDVQEARTNPHRGEFKRFSMIQA